MPSYAIQLADPTFDIEAKDTYLQKTLRGYGKQAGNKPCWVAVTYCVVTLIIVCGGLFVADGEIFSEEDIQIEWSVQGSKTQEGVKFVQKEFDEDDPWSGGLAAIAMFTPKQEGDSSLLYRPHLLEIHKVQKAFYELTVKVGDLEYTMHDICARGMLPDTNARDILAPEEILPEDENKTFINIQLPCIVVGPVSAFNESALYQTPEYRRYEEKIAAKVLSGNLFRVFKTKPSLNTATNEEILEMVNGYVVPAVTHEQIKLANEKPMDSRGVYGYLAKPWKIGDWAGGDLAWSGGNTSNTLVSASGLRSIFLTDAPARIRHRMQLNPYRNNTGHMDLANIEEAIELIMEKWDNQVNEMNDQMDLIKIYHLSPNAFDEALGDEVSNLAYVLISAVLMYIFVGAVLSAPRHPMASRACIGTTGLTVIVFTIIQAICCVLLFGFKLNAASGLVAPLLALAIGCDDMFVILRYFSSTGHAFLTTRSSQEILGQVMATAGPGITLTSTCNVLVGLCGLFLPVKGMQDFCFALTCVSFSNYLSMVFMFVPLLYLEIKRINKGMVDPHMPVCLCHVTYVEQNSRAAPTGRRPSFTATSSEFITKSIEKRFTRWLKLKYVPLVNKLPVAISFCALGIFLVIISVVFISNKELGWGPADMVAKDSIHYEPLKMIFEKFSRFPANIIITDVDIPNKQTDIADLIAQLNKGKYITGAEYMTLFNICLGAFGISVKSPSSALHMFYDPLLLNTNPNSTEFMNYNATWFYSYWHWAAQVPNVEESWLTSKMPSYLMDLGGSNQWKYVENTKATYPGPLFPDPFIHSGAVKAAVGEFSQPVRWNYELRVSKLPFMSIGLKSEAEFMNAIDEWKEIVANGPESLREEFVYSIIGVFWEVFAVLDVYLYALFGVGAAIIFIVTLVFFSGDVIVASCTTISSVMIAVEIYGFACALMSFNIFVLSMSLMGLAMSVEFVVHLTAAISLGSGDMEERLGDAMLHTVPALLEGSMSTFLGVLPLAFHPAMFFMKYNFTIVTLCVVVGLINGVMVLPAMLCLLGRVMPPKRKEKETEALPANISVPAAAENNEAEPPKPAVEPATNREEVI
jgi:hypothetical protein